MPALFDDEVFEHDCRSLPRAAPALRAARKRYEEEGVPQVERYKCLAEHRSGAELQGCFKVYVPGRGDPWRIVFQVTLRSDGTYALSYLAAGLGHTPRQGRRLDVYKLAHYRLHKRWPDAH